MLSTISRLRLLHGRSFRSITKNPICRKNFNSQTKVLANFTNFEGYRESLELKYCNSHRNKRCHKAIRQFSTRKNSPDFTERELTPLEFDKISGETLDSLTEYFDELVEQAEHLTDADVSYGDGVLTVKFGGEYGTYVINRQTPNKQIWLSSPTSGPKRYDFINGRWIYRHDGKTMHELLDDEMPTVVKKSTKFSNCSYGGKSQ